MERDKALLRALLEYITVGTVPKMRLRIVYDHFNASREQVDYHVRLLVQAGHIQGVVWANGPLVGEVTWAGHEYLDQLRKLALHSEVEGLLK